MTPEFAGGINPIEDFDCWAKYDANETECGSCKFQAPCKAASNK